jgi:hypothetical protein
VSGPCMLKPDHAAECQPFPDIVVAQVGRNRAKNGPAIGQSTRLVHVRDDVKVCTSTFKQCSNISNVVERIRNGLEDLGDIIRERGKRRRIQKIRLAHRPEPVKTSFHGLPRRRTRMLHSR